MIDTGTVRLVMKQWNVFLAACVFVGGLMVKFGVPPSAVFVGIGTAGLVNLVMRRVGSRSRL